MPKNASCIIPPSEASPWRHQGGAMRSSAARTTGSGGWDDDWGDAFPAAPQTPAYQQPTTQPGAAFAYQQEAYPQQAWAPAPAPAPAPASGFMQTQQSAQ